MKVDFRITEDVNSRLNQLAGAAGQDRSKIARLALLDVLYGTNHFRKLIQKSVQMNAAHGHGLVIVEVI